MTPVLIFSAAPLEDAKFKDFFGREDLRTLLEEPGELRHAGWDLRTRDRVHLGSGQCLQVGLGERKLLQLYEDGTFLVRASASSSFLSWGEAKEDDAPRLNPVALIEFTYNFVSLYQRIALLFEVPPKSIRFGVQIEKAWLGDESGPKLWLSPYGVNTFEWMAPMERREAPAASVRLSTEVAIETLRNNPGRVAFLLLERVYLWFTFTGDKIPYSELRDGERCVSPELLVAKNK